MEVGLLVVVVLVIAVLARLMAGSLDGERIDEYVKARGGRVTNRSWAPFGKGWVGEKNDRIYEVEYEDRDGQVHRATVKTSMFSGVYLTDDRVVRRSAAEAATTASKSAPAAATAAEDEMARLRAENERLKAALARRNADG